MFNESVKNFMMGDVSGLSNQLQASAATRKTESAAGGPLGGTSAVFASEVKRIYESELNVTASKKDVVMSKKTDGADNKDNKNNAGDIDDNAFIGTDFTDNRLDQANDIITNALAMISDLLGLPEDTKLDSANALRFDPECMDQLAHIMIGVDQALELLGAVSPDVHIEISVRKFVDVGLNVFPFSQLKNSGEVAEFTSGLRMARSHIELGLNMLNMRDIMAEKVTAKGGTPVTSGVVQAVNPSELGMSVSDTAQVFSSLIREDMTAAMERLRMITSGQAEMTELERAALNMGAIKSGILSAAMSNPDEPLAAFDFANVNLTVNAESDVNVGAEAVINVDVNTGNGMDVNENINAGTNNNINANTNINTGINTVADIKADTVVKSDVIVDNENVDNDVIGVNIKDVDTKYANTQEVNTKNLKKEVVHANGINGIKAENIEADVAETDNVKATAPAVINGKKHAVARDFDLPISVSDGARNSVRENVEIANRKALTSAEPLTAKIFFAAADDGAEVPVSMTESVSNNKVHTYTGNAHVDTKIDINAGKNVNIDNNTNVNTKAVNTGIDIDVDSNTGNDTGRIDTVAAKTETPAPKAAPAAIDNGIDVPVSASESVHNNVKSTHGEKSVNTAVNTHVNIKADVDGKIGINTGVNANVNKNVDVADVAKSPSTKSAPTDSDAAEIPVSVMASTSNEKSAEKKSVSNSERVVKSETLTKAPFADNVNANVNANVNVNTNANANINTSSNVNTDAAPASTESGVGMAFGETGVNGVNKNDGNVIDDNNVSEIDGGEQDIGQLDIAESKASQVIDKAEKTANAFSRLENEVLIRQITEKMYQAVRNGVHEIRMTLRPETLGEVRMSIRVQGDVVMAKMQVENRQVKAIVESNMQSLKDDLEKHNLRLDGFSVDVGTDSDKSPRQMWREMAEASGNSGNRKFRQDADGSSDDPATNDNADSIGAALGSDTGRRFGSNTFEYFI